MRHVAQPARAVVIEVQPVRVDHVRQLIPVPDVVPRRAVHVLQHPQAVVVVGIRRRAAPVHNLAQLPAADPRVAPRAVAGQVPLRVIAQAGPVVLGQLVLPVAVPVGTGDRLLHTAQRARGVGVPLPGINRTIIGRLRPSNPDNPVSTSPHRGTRHGFDLPTQVLVEFLLAVLRKETIQQIG